MKIVKENLALMCFLFLLIAAPLAGAQDEAGAPEEGLVVNEANSLDELLENVRDRRVVENREHIDRENRFTRDKANQARMLKDAEAERRREERRSDRLETTFEENEIRIGDMTEQLDKRLGSLRELFGVLQQVAGDTRGLFEASIISSQYPNRGEWLGELAAKMGTSSQLATIEEMEELWFEMQREMTETAKISKYPGTITMMSGEKVNTEIIRVGSYALLGEGNYLQWDSDTQSIVELPRQPAGRHTDTAEELQEAEPGEVGEFSVDPTRGSLLALLIQAATFGEQVGTFMGVAECFIPFCDGQGGTMGAIIIMGLFVGIALSAERLYRLFVIGRNVNAQRYNPNASDDNPLGRVLGDYEENKGVDVETLELKLGEAILSETPSITKNIMSITKEQYIALS